jgi:N-acyl-D-aspartate/D-glutamate deacylase
MTGEQADWFGVDAGKIRVGDRADLTVIDPARFDQNLEAVSWAEMDGFDGLPRMVNRNPGLVPLVLINGKVAFENDAVAPELGKAQGFGQFLPAH